MCLYINILKDDMWPDGVDLPEVEEFLLLNLDLAFAALYALHRLVFQGYTILRNGCHDGVEPLPSLEGDLDLGSDSLEELSVHLERTVQPSGSYGQGIVLLLPVEMRFENPAQFHTVVKGHR